MQGLTNILAGLNYPSIPTDLRPVVRVSSRLRRTGGYYKWHRNEIVYAKLFIERRSLDEIVELACHELIHWALWKTGFQDKTPHGPNFRIEAERLGVDGIHCMVFTVGGE